MLYLQIKVRRIHDTDVRHKSKIILRICQAHFDKDVLGRTNLLFFFDTIFRALKTKKLGGHADTQTKFYLATTVVTHREKGVGVTDTETAKLRDTH